MVHELKIWTQYFPSIATGLKPFEVRRNDRDYSVGDTLLLKEYDPKAEAYMSRSCLVEITYILHGGGFGLEPGFCCMGVKVLQVDWFGAGITVSPPLSTQLTPLQVIEALRASDRYIEVLYQEGSCYKLYQLLKTLFPDAKPMINERANHVGALIGDAVYDITGDVTNAEKWRKLTKAQEATCKEWDFWANNCLKLKECPACEEHLTYETACEQHIQAKVKEGFE